MPPPVNAPKLKAPRSHSTTQMQFSVPTDIAQLVRQWAGEEYHGRTGLLFTKLVYQEVGRREERDRISKARHAP